jgi:hypothetical protein
MNKPTPDDRAVKSIFERVCSIANMPCNESLHHCNVSAVQIQRVQEAFRNVYGYSVPVQTSDTVYSITEKLKHVTQ